MFSFLSLLALHKLAVMLESLANSQRSNSLQSFGLNGFATFGKCHRASHWFVVRHPPALSHYQLPKYPLLLGRGLFEIHLGKGGHFVVRREEMDAI